MDGSVPTLFACLEEVEENEEAVEDDEEVGIEEGAPSPVSRISIQASSAVIGDLLTLRYMAGKKHRFNLRSLWGQKYSLFFLAHGSLSSREYVPNIYEIIISQIAGSQRESQENENEETPMQCVQCSLSRSRDRR